MAMVAGENFPDAVYCKTCQFWLADDSQMSHHVKGEMHLQNLVVKLKKELKALKASLKTSSNAPPPVAPANLPGESSAQRWINHGVIQKGYHGGAVRWWEAD